MKLLERLEIKLLVLINICKGDDKHLMSNIAGKIRLRRELFRRNMSLLILFC